MLSLWLDTQDHMQGQSTLTFASTMYVKLCTRELLPFNNVLLTSCWPQRLSLKGCFESLRSAMGITASGLSGSVEKKSAGCPSSSDCI